VPEGDDLSDSTGGGRAVFLAETVSGIERRFASLPAFARPALWAHATLPEHAGFRVWLHAQVDQLHPAVLDGYISRLLDSAQHTQAVAELAAGAAMRLPGYTVEFGPVIDGLTPDLLVTEPDGRKLIAEVWTRGLSDGAESKNRQWAGLAQRITRIPVAVALAADAIDPSIVKPPDQHARGRIARELKRWLMSGRHEPGAAHACEGLVFRIVGTTTTGNAELLPIHESSTADRKDVVEAIERKVARYRRLATKYDLPFVVVLCADEGTGLTREHVDHVLAGKNLITMTIPLYGVGQFDSGPIEIRQSEAPPVFDPALSAVAWLEVKDGGNAHISLWPMPAAARPVAAVSPSR
jgi:hypothetical protein